MNWPVFRRLALGFTALLSACSNGQVGVGGPNGEPQQRLERSWSGQVEQNSEIELQLLGRLRAFVGFHERLDLASPLSLVAGRIRRRALVPSNGVDVTLPRSGRQPLRFDFGGHPDGWIEICADEPDDVEGKLVGNTVVYRATNAESAVVRVTGPGFAEESRLIESATSLHPIEYKFSHGSQISRIELENGVVRILDAAAHVMVQSQPMFAVDAIGTKRFLSLSMQSDNDNVVVHAELSSGGLVFPIAIDPIWQTPNTMLNGHDSHAAAALPDGTVLVSGGQNETGATGAAAESWSPLEQRWVSAGEMQSPRMSHTLTNLSGGRVLAVGGIIAGGTTSNTSEIFTPPTTWDSIAMLASRRLAHSASSLSTGGVLVAGGADETGRPVATSEVYDPSQNTWRPTGDMAEARAHHAAVTLADGSVLVMGGLSGQINPVLDSVELWDGTRWTSRRHMSTARYFHTATVLPSGQVLVVGGGSETGDGLDTAELYDPSTDVWNLVPSAMSTTRFQHAATLVGQYVLIMGGEADDVGSAELYDPVANAFRTLQATSIARLGPTLTPLGDGYRALAAGGMGPDGTALNTSELYDPTRPGLPCVAGTQCYSGICVDGVCCDALCDGQCQACDLANQSGHCTAVSGGPAHGQRLSCGAYLCVAGACATSCADNSACAASDYCSNGVCVSKLDLGSSCSGDEQCTSAHCTDRVCCDQACGRPCEACNAQGHCRAISGPPSPPRAPCGDRTDCALTCDGVNPSSCAYPGADTACGSNACSSGVETHTSTCDGAGQCQPSARSCETLICGPTACKTRCATIDDCIGGYYCNDFGECVRQNLLGVACTTDEMCEGLHCVDSVCCGESMCAEGRSCSSPTEPGRCMLVTGQSCRVNEECGTGFCVDDVCCDTACDGQCETCSPPGNPGTCSAVRAGPPVGQRPACPGPTSSDPCTASVCDGSERRSCAGRVDRTVECRAPSCAAGSLMERAVCDGTGQCPMPIIHPCADHFACADARACGTTCLSNGDCASPFQCENGKCDVVPSCVASASAMIDGALPDCGGYLCDATGQCKTSCTTKDDCVPDLDCDSSGRCVKVTQTLPLGLTCAVGSMGGSASTSRRLAWLAVLLAGSTWICRRRRTIGSRSRSSLNGRPVKTRSVPSSSE